LLPSPSGINIPVEAIFDKTSRVAGIKELQRKLSLLPAGTRIIWLSGLTSGQIPKKQSRKLALPPWQTVENVKRYARQLRIQVEIVGSTLD